MYAPNNSSSTPQQQQVAASFDYATLAASKRRLGEGSEGNKENIEHHLPLPPAIAPTNPAKRFHKEDPSDDDDDDDEEEDEEEEGDDEEEEESDFRSDASTAGKGVNPSASAAPGSEVECSPIRQQAFPTTTFGFPLGQSTPYGGSGGGGAGGMAAAHQQLQQQMMASYLGSGGGMSTPGYGATQTGGFAYPLPSHYGSYGPTATTTFQQQQHQQYQQLMASYSHGTAGLYASAAAAAAAPNGLFSHHQGVVPPSAYAPQLPYTPDSGINSSLLMMGGGGGGVGQLGGGNLSSGSGSSSTNNTSSGSGGGGATSDESYSGGGGDGEAKAVPGEGTKNALALTPYYRPSTIMTSSNLLPFDPNFKYCEVPGRLALLSNTKKYPVYLAEIQRRISPPECLNASYLGGILRKAKNKNGGKALREQLKQFSMHLPSGRRKSATITTFTSLCEEEAKQMAVDFSRLNERDFPKENCARDLVKAFKSPEEMGRRMSAVMSASQLVGEAISMVRCVEMGQEAVVPIDGDTRESIIRFSRLTHGFGNVAVLRAWETFQEILHHAFLKLQSNMGGGSGEGGGGGVFSTPRASSSSLLHASATSGESTSGGSGSGSSGQQPQPQFSRFARVHHPQQQASNFKQE